MKQVEVTILLRNNRLKARRVKLGFTQHDMARYCGVSYTFYCQLEQLRKTEACGETWIKTKEKIALALDCDVLELFPPELEKIKRSKIVAFTDTPRLQELYANTQKVVEAAKGERAFNEEVETSVARPKLLSIIGELPEREQQVIKLRFGIDEQRPKTLEEVGKELKSTRERIRQIEAKVIRKLRQPFNSIPLRKAFF